ncbi:hypothetical protein F4777DRAFT_570642 [Nemania sp. FL0916]|nr:hypothetical protein F4777DRAFT_570642 [Nemania sp. FL0916]
MDVNDADDANFVALKRTWTIARDILRLLVKLPEAHLTDGDLKKLHIICTDLDLTTGKPADGSEIFIRPFPIARIHEKLERTKPWLRCPLDDEKETMPLAAALEILNCLNWSLSWDGNGEAIPLIMETPWKSRGMQYFEGERLCRHILGGPDWKVQTVLDKMDGTTPHISCLLADDAPFKGDQLSNAEIWCIIAITNRRLRLPEYHNHRIIPVTVISAADRQLRIVQGYVDGEHDCIRVRKSPMLDFERYDPQKMELVLSWCVGDPVGHTQR